MQAEHPIPLKATGWTRGFRSLWQKEMGEWWRTKQALIHALIWVALVNGLMGMGTFAAQFNPTEFGSVLQFQVNVFLSVGAGAGAIGVIIVMQSSLIGERQSGTAAWILSKPASRTAFILAKFGTNAVSFLSLAVILPSSIAYPQALLLGEAWPVGPYLAGVGILLLHALFYLTLTLMLGALFSSRGPVLGIALGLALFGNTLSKLPLLAYILPSSIPYIGMGFFGGMPMIPYWPIPLVVTFLFSVLFLVIAVRRLQCEEL